MSKTDVAKTEQKVYRSNFGATILFSGVQFFQIIITVVRSKFVALFIGTTGMGISSLLHSATDLISACTNFGLKTSGVKTVASASESNDYYTVAKTIAVLRRLILCTGLLGTLICIGLSPLLSKSSFDSGEYTMSFVIVSLVILFNQLNNGELVLLQGLRKKELLAKANVIGQTLGLILTVPLYYFYGIKAIVWVLVLSSLLTFLISSIYSRKLKIERVSISWKETFGIGWEMIKLGIFLSLQFLLSQLALYLIRNYVSQTGGVDQVGLYSAGTTIINTYLGLVFTAIATDYFPRLSSMKSFSDMNEAVRRQAELSMLLFAPIIVAFIVYIRPIIILLYSDKFLPIEYMLYWGMSATLIKAMGWSLSYTILAKAKPAYFFLNEVIAKCYTFPITILGYKYFGLTGFGIALLIGYAIYLVQEMIVTKHLFGTSFPRYIWKLFVVLNLPILVVLFIKMIPSATASYLMGTIVLIITGLYVYNKLNKLMDLNEIVKSKMGKYKHTK